MYKNEISELLTGKLNNYQNKLEEIEDRLDTLDPDIRDDIQMELNTLYRDFEDLESRLDEIDLMSEEEILDEEEVILNKIECIEDSLSDFMQNLYSFCY